MPQQSLRKPNARNSSLNSKCHSIRADQMAVMRTSNDGRTGLLFPFADPRAYTDRLNQLFTPAGWSCEYSISTVPSLTRVDRGKVIVTSKILVASAVTINRLGSHAGTGEAWADRDMPRRPLVLKHSSAHVRVSGWGAISTAS